LHKIFENLPEDKRKRIVDVCVEEFSRKGYDKASTNTIVKEAGISKGILFHYFGSKKNLYLYIVDYVMDYMTKKFYIADSNPPADIFERIMDRGLVKLKMAYDDPSIYNLLFEAFINTPEDLKGDIQERYKKIKSENLSVFLNNIDTSKFRGEIDKNKAIELIMLLMEALTSKYIDVYKNKPADAALTNMDKMIAEYMEYIDIMKKGIY